MLSKCGSLYFSHVRANIDIDLSSSWGGCAAGRLYRVDGMGKAVAGPRRIVDGGELNWIMEFIIS